MNCRKDCRKGRINNTQTVGNIFIKTAVRAESSRRLRLKREMWSLFIAKKKGMSVPRVIDYYIDHKGQEVLKTEAVINGKVLTTFPIGLQIQVMKKIGSEILKLELVSEKFGWPNPNTLKGEFDKWGLFLYDFTRRYGQRLVDRSILPNNFLESLLERISGFNFNLKNSGLVHRDIKPNNILCTENLNEYWLIDWENSLLGDQLFDLASYGANYGRDCLWEGLADGFGSSAVMPEKYELYEMIVLIGAIDFYRNQGIDYSQKLKKLLRM
ncbi:MAG: aminoglycoside phosphotransferase family protein [bacterium]|nr:aminoglycoside phosphotransferase family protein [bacterium]